MKVYCKHCKHCLRFDGALPLRCKAVIIPAKWNDYSGRCEKPEVTGELSMNDNGDCKHYSANLEGRIFACFQKRRKSRGKR